MAFRRGQRVICVKRGKWVGQDYDLVAWPVYGETYTIRDIVDDSMHPVPGVGFRFEEVVNPVLWHAEGMHEPTFHSIRFRPVRTTDISVFTKLLAPAPKRKVKERA